jgi:Mg-chelatase subunit ChlD/PKD repeat protein
MKDLNYGVGDILSKCKRIKSDFVENILRESEMESKIINLKAITSFAVFLVILAIFTSGVQASEIKDGDITREKMMEIAEAYENHVWNPTLSNVYHGDVVDTPDSGYSGGWWIVNEPNTGIPYQWGGFSSLDGLGLVNTQDWDFDEQIQDKYYGGDINTVDVSQKAAGVDCSGFISRTWNLSYKRGSVQLASEDCSTPIKIEDLKPGDMLYTIGHVMLFKEFSNPEKTQLVVYEASGWDWKVSERTYEVGEFLFDRETGTKEGYGATLKHGNSIKNYWAYRYNGINEGNANVMLVIDRSGSMYGSPISSAKNSANLFIDYMESEDKAGVVSFSTSASYDYHLAILTPEVKNDIKLKINSISSSGTTAIGSGLRYGLNDLLNYGDQKNPQAIVLLSDGQQNSGENPSSVVPLIQANNIQVYTVGLGSSVDEDLLKNIASQTGGKYYYSPTDSQLQEIYNEIVGEILDLDTAKKLTINMVKDDVVSEPVKIDSTVEKASFGISWPGSNVDLILYKPDGSIVDSSVADSDPNIEYLTGSTYKIYKVTNPEPGEWTMELTATDMPAGGEDVYVTVRAKSTLSMLLSTDKDQYKQGESVKIVADLSDAVAQIKDADVEAIITLPDSNIESLTLYDDGSHGDGEAQDGVYANFFLNTLLKGDYKIDATSTGSLSDGSQFNRIEDISFEIIPGSPIIVEAGSDQTVEEGASVNFEGSITASESHTYSYRWDFGDGSVEDSSLITSHTYADNGIYTVNLTVTDKEGNFGNDTLLVTVNNAIPVVDSGSDLEVTAGNPVSFSGTFSDLGWLDTHTAEWNLGEGTVEAGSVSEENEYPNSTGTVSGNFSYFDTGEYTVTLNVADDDSGIGQDQLTVTVRPIEAEVTFDPETFNLNSTGDWVTAYIELPAGYSVSGIDIGSILLNDTVHAVSDPKYDFVTNESEYLKDLDLDGISERMFKFNRGEVAGVLKAGDQVTVTFTGKVEYNNGISSGMASFEGSDVIKVTESKNKK